MNRKLRWIGTVALTGVLAINQCCFFSENIIKADAEERTVEVGETEKISQAASLGSANNPYGLVSATEGNILHAWNWSLKTIKEQLPEIAKAGYSVVQTSPLQSCEDYFDNNDWWKSYQPYDYAYGSVFGTEEEFKELCEEAHQYGIRIIVDVVANHVAGSQDGSIDPGVDYFWTSDRYGLFHNMSTKPSDVDRASLVLSNLGMPDINTENEKVQARLVDYMQQLINDGADGFRFDAAKYIGTSSDTGSSYSNFWVNTVGKIKAKYPDKLYYGQILNKMLCSPNPVAYYVKDGLKVTESQIGWGFKDAVHSKSLRRHTKSGNAEVITYDRSIVDGIDEKDQVNWVENHDTYLNYWGSTGLEGAITYMSDEQIVLSWSALASRADTQSLYFARPDGCSKPDNPNPAYEDSNHIDGTIDRLTSNSFWKDKKVVVINQFKNAMIGENESVSTAENAVIIRRGNKGVVVTNFGATDTTVEVTGLSGLADGSYEDASGQNGTIHVSGGKASIRVKKSTFAVLYQDNTEPLVTPTVEPVETITVTPTVKPTIIPTNNPLDGEITNITNVVFRDPDMKVTKETKFQLSDLVITLEFASGEEYDTVNHPELEKYLQIEQVDCGNNRFLVNIKCVLEGGRMLTCTRYADINAFASEETEKPIETVEPEETENPETTEKPGMTEKPKQTGTPSPSPKPTMSASPMVSQTPKVSATPDIPLSQPEATKGALLGETGPKPTVFNPAVEATTTPKPTQNPTQENAVKVGAIFLYKNVKYKVIEYNGKIVANVSLIGYNKSASSLTLADQVKYKDKYFKVVKIEKGVFKNAKNLKGSLKLPKHLVSIGNSAFEGCSGLTELDIQSKVKKIGKKAFYNCKNVKKVFFRGKNLKSVGANAFKNLHQKRGLFVSKKYMDYYKKLLKNKI